MPFAKGHEKLGGRKKGSLNKRTLLLSMILQDLPGRKTFDWQKELIADLKAKDKSRLDFWNLLMPYLVARPAITPIEIDSSPATPEESKRNALLAQERMKKLEEDARSGVGPFSNQPGMEYGSVTIPAPFPPV